MGILGPMWVGTNWELVCWGRYPREEGMPEKGVGMPEKEVGMPEKGVGMPEGEGGLPRFLGEGGYARG